MSHQAAPKTPQSPVQRPGQTYRFICNHQGTFFARSFTRGEDDQQLEEFIRDMVPHQALSWRSLRSSMVFHRVIHGHDEAVDDASGEMPGETSGNEASGAPAASTHPLTAALPMPLLKPPPVGSPLCFILNNMVVEGTWSRDMEQKDGGMGSLLAFRSRQDCIGFLLHWSFHTGGPRPTDTIH